MPEKQVSSLVMGKNIKKKGIMQGKLPVF